MEARANTLSVGTEDTGLKALYDRSHLVPIGHNGLLANTAILEAESRGGAGY